ncbi:MAG: glycosyltransferase [Dehalococcoidia bacterium]
MAHWNVLKIAPTSFFADYGCHVRILEETAALQRLGHRVTIVTYPSGGGLPGIDIRRAFPIPLLQSIKAGPSKRKPIFDVLLAARTLQVALAVRPNVIHAHLHEGALIGAVVARLLRVPLVFDFQGSLTSEMIDHGWLSRESSWYRRLLAIERLITRLPDAIITSSHNAAALLVRSSGSLLLASQPSPTRSTPLGSCHGGSIRTPSDWQPSGDNSGSQYAAQSSSILGSCRSIREPANCWKQRQS